LIDAQPPADSEQARILARREWEWPATAPTLPVAAANPAAPAIDAIPEDSTDDGITIERMTEEQQCNDPSAEAARGTREKRGYRTIYGCGTTPPRR
jgi:hypothetical protein